jgi:hypothetical protein
MAGNVSCAKSLAFVELRHNKNLMGTTMLSDLGYSFVPSVLEVVDVADHADERFANGCYPDESKDVSV